MSKDDKYIRDLFESVDEDDITLISERSDIPDKAARDRIVSRCLEKTAEAPEYESGDTVSGTEIYRRSPVRKIVNTALSLTALAACAVCVLFIAKNELISDKKTSDKTSGTEAAFNVTAETEIPEKELPSVSVPDDDGQEVDISGQEQNGNYYADQNITTVPAYDEITTSAGEEGTTESATDTEDVNDIGAEGDDENAGDPEAPENAFVIAGEWNASSGESEEMYYFSGEFRSGKITRKSDNSTENFEYAVNGDVIELYFIEPERKITGTIAWNDSSSFTVVWESGETQFFTRAEAETTTAAHTA